MLLIDWLIDWLIDFDWLIELESWNLVRWYLQEAY